MGNTKGANFFVTKEDRVNRKTNESKNYLQVENSNTKNLLNQHNSKYFIKKDTV